MMYSSWRGSNISEAPREVIEKVKLSRVKYQKVVILRKTIDQEAVKMDYRNSSEVHLDKYEWCNGDIWSVASKCFTIFERLRGNGSVRVSLMSQDKLRRWWKNLKLPDQGKFPDLEDVDITIN